MIKSERPSCPSGTYSETAAAQDEIGAIIQIGAAVASIKYDNFAREIFASSVTGRITAPTVKQLK